MCTFCNRFKARLSTDCGSYKSDPSLCFQTSSSDEASQFSESEEESICSKHYSALRRKYQPRLVSKPVLKAAVRFPQERSRQLESGIKNRDILAKHKSSSKLDLHLLTRIDELERLVKEKDKTIAALTRQNERFRPKGQPFGLKNSNLVQQIASKVQAQLRLQRDEETRLADLIKEMEKLTVSNSELARSLTHHGLDSQPPQSSKERQVRETHKQKRPKETRWKDNFVQVFLDLMSRLSLVEGFTIPEGYSLRKKVKASWRFLKQFIRFYQYDKKHSEKATILKRE